MGELLGIGMSHGPHPRLTDETMTNAFFRHVLSHDITPAELKDPSNWPLEMQKEWGDDEGLTAGRAHREENLRGFRAIREAIDEFNPDFVVMFGDDQYENFHEDLLTPFCFYAFDSFDTTKPKGGTLSRSAIEHPGSNTGTPISRPPFQDSVAGLKEIGTQLANEMVERGFDVSCAWKLLHAPRINHAFYYSLDYLDWDRKGFPYPLLPIHVNCYGADLRFPVEGRPNPPLGTLAEPLSPPPPDGPPPWRCYDLGKALGQAIEASPYRAVIIGSASWSHGSLTPMHSFLWGDVDGDRLRLAELEANKFDTWRDFDPEEMRYAGRHEMRNWICMVGAMEGKTATVTSWAESYIFNSSKCTAIFR
jgi:catalytic LigB subunit of aromatic ring-opening dioxygenase